MSRLSAATAVAALLFASSPASADSYLVQPGPSFILIVTGVEGLLSAFGHEHALLADAPRGAFCVGGDPAAASGEVVVATGSLVIDAPRARRIARLDEGPPPDTIAELQQKVLSSRFLAARQHPRITLTIDAIETGRGEGRVAGGLTIRGVTRQVAADADVQELRDGARRIRGGFVVRQTDFGIEPESVAGVVDVTDEVDVWFDLVVAPGGDACAAGT